MIIINEFSFVELYDVFFKAQQPLEIAGVVFEKNETICVFDKIQISNFNQLKSRTSAKGGFHNTERVFWEDEKGIEIFLSQGVFNKAQFALLCNANLVYKKPNSQIYISKREETETSEQGIITISHEKIRNLFIYEKESGKKINHIVQDKNLIQTGKPFIEVVLDYEYEYKEPVEKLILGNQLINGFLTMEAKTKVKEDITGKEKTALIKIPKLKLMSSLQMRLGKTANPVVLNMELKGVPSGSSQNQEVMELLFLPEEIDCDI